MLRRGARDDGSLRFANVFSEGKWPVAVGDGFELQAPVALHVPERPELVVVVLKPHRDAVLAGSVVDAQGAPVPAPAWRRRTRPTLASVMAAPSTATSRALQHALRRPAEVLSAGRERVQIDSRAGAARAHRQTWSVHGRRARAAGRAPH